jgi:hypothetical protein
VNGNEHRGVGDAASGGALVNVGGASAHEQFWLSFGDVMALSGDYFGPGPSASSRDDSRFGAGDHTGTLFSLARIPGEQGARPGTRDEIICALHVMTVDEAFVDPRFELGGEYAGFTLARTGRDVERRVRDRYLILAATNDDHFADPGGITHDGSAGSVPFGSAPLAYRRLHEVALEEARRLGRVHGDTAQALAREAAAQHFLTDAFTAGHMRTPVAQIRRFWRARYPTFWEDLRGRVAADTVATLRELAWALRLLPERFLYDATLAAVRRRTDPYPQLSVGDFLARLLHDWDNTHGLTIDGGAVVFGDGHVHKGATRPLAVTAARAGIDDIEAAFALGAAGNRLTGESLYRAVRTATGAGDHLFRPESMIPRPSSLNPPQNWRAPDLESLWDGPIVGGSETTVGEALTEMMDPDGLFIRQLDRLGQSLVDARGLLAVPLLGGWLAGNGAQAYHRGFVEQLATHPRQAILSVVHADAGGERAADDARAARTPYAVPWARQL